MAGLGRSTTYAFIAKDQFSKVAGQVEKKAGGMGKGFAVMGKVAAVGFAAVAAGVAMAVPAMVNMGKAAMEDEAAQRKLALGLKNTTGATDAQVASVEEWITAQGVALGVADDDLRPALERLARATGDVGKAQELASLAMDVSAGTGKSLSQVSEALMKAQNGQVGALGRLGIKTKDASGKTLTFDQITKDMAKTFKGQASGAANTLQGRMGRLSLAFSEAKESIGAKLLPVAEKLVGWVVNKGIPAFKRFMDDQIKPLAAKVMPMLRDIWTKVTDAFDRSRPGIEKLGIVVKAMGKIWADYVIPNVGKAASVILPKLIEVIGWLGDKVPGIAVVFLRFGADVVDVWRNIYNAALWAVENTLAVLGKMPGKMGEPFRRAGDAVKAYRQTVNDVMGGAADAMRDAADSIIASVERANRETKLKADISDLQSKIATAKEKLKDPALSATKRAQLKADIAQLEAQVRKAKADLASVRSKTVKISVVYTSAGRVYATVPGTNKPIPLNAAGGMTAGPTLGIMGEAGREALLPLERPSVMRQIASAIVGAMPGGSRSGGGQPVVVQLHLDGRVIQQSVLTYERATGRPILTAGVA